MFAWRGGVVFCFRGVGGKGLSQIGIRTPFPEPEAMGSLVLLTEIATAASVV